MICLTALTSASLLMEAKDIIAAEKRVIHRTASGSSRFAALACGFALGLGCGSDPAPAEGDAGAGDATLTEDAATEDVAAIDAPTHNDGAPVSGFCASLSPAAAFCDDFDDDDVDD